MADDEFPEARFCQAWAEFESGSLDQLEHGIGLMWGDVRTSRYNDASEMVLRIGERKGLGKLLTQSAALLPLASKCISDFLSVYETVGRSDGSHLDLSNGVPEALVGILRSGRFRNDPAALDSIVWRLASIADLTPDAVPHLVSLGVLDEACGILDLYVTTDYRGLSFKTTWLVSLLLAGSDPKISFAHTCALVPGLTAAVLCWPIQSLEYVAPSLSAIFTATVADVDWPLLLTCGLWPRLVTLAVSKTRSVSMHAAQIFRSAAVALYAATSEVGEGDLRRALTPATLVTGLASLARALVRNPSKLTVAHLMAALHYTAAAAPAGGPCGANAVAVFAASDPLGPVLPLVSAALERPIAKFSEWHAAAEAAHVILALLRTYTPDAATPAQLSQLTTYLDHVGAHAFIALANRPRNVPKAMSEPAEVLANAMAQIQLRLAALPSQSPE
jgi:hypothetical protein